MKCSFSAEQFGETKPWVAEITGLDDRYGYARQFLSGRKDYSAANSKGTRGIWFYWSLAPGRLYEVHYHSSWSRQEQMFLWAHKDGELERVSREEVEAWVSRDSELTFSPQRVSE